MFTVKLSVFKLLLDLLTLDIFIKNPFIKRSHKYDKENRTLIQQLRERLILYVLHVRL